MEFPVILTTASCAVIGHQWEESGSIFILPIGHSEQRGRITSFGTLETLFLMQPRVVVAFLGTKGHCWFMFKLFLMRIHKYFSAKQTVNAEILITHFSILEVPLNRRAAI